MRTLGVLRIPAALLIVILTGCSGGGGGGGTSPATGTTLVAIELAPLSPSIRAGQTQQVKATGIYSDSSTQDLTTSVVWTLSTGTIATVSPTGLATAKTIGKATITASSGTINGETTLTVTNAVDLPKTGQTTSYAIGDDGDLQKGVGWPNPRFTDNSDGTITDNLTGLMWLKDANCIATSYPSFDTDLIAGDGAVTWENAFLFISGVNSGTYPNCGGGHTDWRLPNSRELWSLAFMPAGHPFSNFGIYYYWSSTTYPDGPDSGRWVVFVISGDLLLGFTHNSVSYNHVWPVRDTAVTSTISLPRTGQVTCYDTIWETATACAGTGQDGELQKGVAWPDPRFTDNADGTVTDNLTGLTWSKDANCIATHYPSFDTDGTAGDGAVTWQHALDFVAGINNGMYPDCGGGRYDWRVPNIIELESLADFAPTSPPALPVGYPFTNVPSGIFWSSSTCAGCTSYAWSGSLFPGVGLSSKSDSIYMLPVRGGQ